MTPEERQAIKRLIDRARRERAPHEGRLKGVTHDQNIARRQRRELKH